MKLKEDLINIFYFYSNCCYMKLVFVYKGLYESGENVCFSASLYFVAYELRQFCDHHQ